MCKIIMESQYIPDSQVHGANMGPIWGRQDPGGPHFGSMNLVIWDYMTANRKYKKVTLFTPGDLLCQ